MANSYKNITITPYRSDANNDPKINFAGANTTVNTDINLYVYPLSNGSLSFEGSAGQLFSITNDLSGTIYSVNDVSGIPSLEVLANGVVRIAQYSGNVGIGIASPSSKLHVQGDVKLSGSFVENVFTITDGASVDINPSNGTVQLWTLGANRTPTANNFSAGQSVTLMILDGTAYTITWSTINPTWVGGTAPTLDTTKYTVIELWKVSTTVYGALVGYA